MPEFGEKSKLGWAKMVDGSHLGRAIRTSFGLVLTIHDELVNCSVRQRGVFSRPFPFPFLTGTGNGKGVGKTGTGNGTGVLGTGTPFV